MSFTLENKVTAGFSVALLLTLIISAVSWRSNDQQSREADWVQHTQEVLARLEALLSSITDGETGQRGFIITGDETYLEPYQTYRVKADGEYQALLRLTANHPLQHARLTNLQPLLEARASEITKNIELRRQGFEVAAQAIRSGHGKALHDQIRYRIGEIEATERDLLMHREIDAKASAKLSRLLIVLRSLLAVGVIAVALVIIHRDIAGRNQVKEALVNANAQLQVATKQAQHADRIKSAFLASMSHELRTPLNSIIGFSGILFQELAGPLNTEQKKQLGMVRDSSRHLLALVNDILDISKIEANQLKVSPIPFPLTESIHKVVTLIMPLVEQKGLALHTQIAPDLGELVADPRRVEQILINVLNNAVKFTESGRITLSAERVADISPPGAAAPTPGVRLQVSDTGRGIRPEDITELFQPFHQVENGLTRSHDGTGLGLAISHRLLALMGGQIYAESTHGKGSVFTLMLPLNGRPLL